MTSNIKEEKIRRFNLASRIQSLYIFNEVKSRYKNVLDLGAGDGEISLILQSKSDKLFSLDSDIKRIKRIQKCLSKSNYDNTTINYCYAQKLPYDDSFFDLIICNSVIEHISDYKKILNEIKRTIKKEGIVIITVPNCDIQFGNFGGKFWNRVLAISLKYRNKLCRNSQLASLSSVEEIQSYFNTYFEHKIQFNIERIQSELNQEFEITNHRYYLNFLSGFFHDLAYYFKIFDNRFLLRFCYFLGWFEFHLLRNKPGKGILIKMKKK